MVHFQEQKFFLSIRLRYPATCASINFNICALVPWLTMGLDVADWTGNRHYQSKLHLTQLDIDTWIISKCCNTFKIADSNLSAHLTPTHNHSHQQSLSYPSPCELWYWWLVSSTLPMNWTITVNSAKHILPFRLVTNSWCFHCLRWEKNGCQKTPVDECIIWKFSTSLNRLFRFWDCRLCLWNVTYISSLYAYLSLIPLFNS